MKKILWLAITLLLVGCVPVQPQQDQQVVDGELNQPVVVEQINEASTAPELPNLSDVEVVGGDEASLRAFIARWFSSPYPGAPSQDTVIHIGELPPDMAFDLPFPPGPGLLEASKGIISSFRSILTPSSSPRRFLPIMTRP